MRADHLHLGAWRVVAQVRAGAQPYLGARTGQGSGDKMIDGVSPCARPLSLLRSSTPRVWRQAPWRELTAAHLLTCGQGTHERLGGVAMPRWAGAGR